MVNEIRQTDYSSWRLAGTLGCHFLFCFFLFLLLLWPDQHSEGFELIKNKVGHDILEVSAPVKNSGERTKGEHFVSKVFVLSDFESESRCARQIYQLCFESVFLAVDFLD